MDLKELEVVLTKHRDDVVAMAKTVASETGDKATAAVSALKAQFEEVAKSLTAVQEQIKIAAQRTVPGLAEQMKKEPFSLSAYLRAQHAMSGDPTINPALKSDPWKSKGDDGCTAEREKAYCEEYAKVRASDANVAGDGSQGGYLIPPEVTNEVIDMAMANLAVMGLGLKVIKGLVGELPLPTVTGRPTAYMLSETEAITKSQASYGLITLRPKAMGAFTKQSKRLIYQSRGVSDQLIKELLSEAMALKMEEMCIIGKGSDKQPLGVINASGMTTNNVGTSGNIAGRIKIDDIGKAIAALDAANEVKPGVKLGLLLRPECKWGMKRERVAQYTGQAARDSAPIMAMNLLMTDELISQQLGINIASSTLLSNREDQQGLADVSKSYSTAILGNWSKFYIGMWRDFSINVSDQAGDGSTGSAFLQNQLYIVAFQEFDTQVVRGSAFTKITGCETNEANW